MLKMREMVLHWFPLFKANKGKLLHKPKTDRPFLSGHVLCTEFTDVLHVTGGSGEDGRGQRCFRPGREWKRIVY